MSQVPAGLNSHNETVGGSRPPVCECLMCGQPVESAVVFDRLVLAGIMFQPAALWHIRRVQHAAPVAVLPAGRAHKNGHALLVPTSASVIPVARLSRATGMTGHGYRSWVLSSGALWLGHRMAPSHNCGYSPAKASSTMEMPSSSRFSPITSGGRNRSTLPKVPQVSTTSPAA